MHAFFDYQGSRVFGTHDPRPPSFHHSFDFGTLSIFVMDLRSNRQAEHESLELFEAQQLEDLKQFLNSRHSAHVVGVVLSVPLVHVPDWMASVGSVFRSPDGDAADRWSDLRAHDCRHRLLEVLRAHQAACPQQRLVLLGGDVHIGAVALLHWGEGIRDSYELISSALSNTVGMFAKELVNLAQSHPVVSITEQGARVDVGLMDCAEDAETPTDPLNPYGGLNIGIVEIERISGSESHVRLRLIGCTEGGEPRERAVFDSGRL